MDCQNVKIFVQCFLRGARDGRLGAAARHDGKAMAIDRQEAAGVALLGGSGRQGADLLFGAYEETLEPSG